MSNYLTPLQQQKIRSIWYRISARSETPWMLLLDDEEVELCKELAFSTAGISNPTGPEIRILLGRLLTEANGIPPPETEAPNFQQVASSVREYIRKEAGTLSVQAMMYAVYSRKDVQKVCGDNMWLINQQIKMALATYVDAHQAEAITFCLQNGSDF